MGRSEIPQSVQHKRSRLIWWTGGSSLAKNTFKSLLVPSSLSTVWGQTAPQADRNHQNHDVISLLAVQTSLCFLFFLVPYISWMTKKSSKIEQSNKANGILRNMPRQYRDLLGNLLNHVIESNKPHVKRAVADLTDLASSTRWLSEFLLDMFYTTMIGLADELEVPSSVLFTSSTAFVSMMLHLRSLQLNSRARPASWTSRVSQTCCQPRFYPPWFWWMRCSDCCWRMSGGWERPMALS